jgi:hypothetical protein
MQRTAAKTAGATVGTIAKLKTPKRAHLYRFRVPLYEVDVYLSVAATIQEARTNLTLGGFPDYETGTAQAITTKGEKDAGKFGLSFCFEKLTFDNIAHEAKHLCSYILGRIGHEADHDNDEPEAYLLGWIVNVVCGILIKRARLQILY